MTDRELLELAAKAAGLRLEWDGHPDAWQPMYYEGKTYHSWDPLQDDGDALRLAVELRLFDTGAFLQFRLVEVRANPGLDDCTLTRRAIVRAAAEIGKTRSD